MKAAVEGPEVTYAEAFPSTDLVYVPTATGFKELVVLREAPAEPTLAYEITATSARRVCSGA